MKLVLDTNIFFSFMNPNSVSSYLLFSLKANFLAPEFIRVELEKHKDECLLKSKLTGQEFEIRQTEVEGKIKFFKSKVYEDSIKNALTALSDPDDADFLALALSINALIWSNDPHLKAQSLVKVFTTEKLVTMMLNGLI